MSNRFVMESVVPVIEDTLKYCESLTEYVRRKSLEVPVGHVPLGGGHPIRIQSMTTVDTMDTQGSVAQAIRMIESGCEYVRLTAPSLKDAQNLENIKNALRKSGYDTPLVADIHFTPNAAELAARIVEKVRINPGNYADRKKFQQIEYTDDAYQAELDRIRKNFTPLIKICKEYGTALRIGTNHGSLSDRIMSRYGDTPLGMVESALEFLRICEDEGFYRIVLSMKASNPQVMVQAYRLLVNKMDAEGMKPYPLHIGVTEAGEGEDGRIKSAMGIGALLEDGLGDTVRVSLTEEPELEAPVAIMLVDRYKDRAGHTPILQVLHSPVNPFEYTRRNSREVGNFGGKNVPRVIADFSVSSGIQMQDLAAIGHYYRQESDKWTMNETGADYLFTGSSPADFMLPNSLKEISVYETWQSKGGPETVYPLLTAEEFVSGRKLHGSLNFVRIKLSDIDKPLVKRLKEESKIVLWLETNNRHAMAELRRAFFALADNHLKTPVVISGNYKSMSEERFRLYASTDIGAVLLAGMGDGVILLLNNAAQDGSRDVYCKLANNTAFGILQAARMRITKTEFISCPSCGRTLFDLQETTAKIRKRTEHLKGLKIGIMGCIVNGPGEMADADYGYVGSGNDKITLYKGKDVVKRGVPFKEAVKELVNLIKSEGDWVDP